MPKLTYTTPPPSLMRELREIPNDAGALAVELAKAVRAIHFVLTVDRRMRCIQCMKFIRCQCQ